MIHKYKRKTSYCILILLISGATLINSFIVTKYNINAYYFYNKQYERMLANRPWFRLPSFLTGVLLSLMVSRIHSARYKVQFKLFSQTLIQFMGLCLVLSSIFLLGFNFLNQSYDPIKQFNQTGSFTILESALYTSLAPLTFNLGLIMILSPSLLYLN